MEREVLIDNEYVSLYYHPDEKIVHHVIHKFVSGEPFRELFRTGSAILKEHGARKWLSEDQHFSVMTPDDAEWLVRVWSPEVRANGWKYWAVVMPVKAASQMNTRDFVARSNEIGVKSQMFDDTASAFTWLKAQ